MKKFILLSLCAFQLAIGSFAQTNISTSFAVNTTLTLANSPYVITNSININDGVTVTIEKGVEVRFNSGVYLQAFGTLNAKGVNFTANTTKTKGFWDGIYVSYEYSASIGSVTLDSCNVEFASNLYSRHGQLTLKKTTLNNFSGHGVQVSNVGTLNITNSVIKNVNYPIYMYGPGKIINGGNNQLTGNAADYVYMAFNNIPGVFDMPNLGIPYYCNYMLVTETGTLNISPGTQLKFVNCEFTISGKIKALGTALNPIIFDMHPTASYWLGINITANAIDTACIFKNCVFKNAKYDYEPYVAMEINSASPSFENCKFTSNARNLIVTGLSKPTFTNCNFESSTLQYGECFNVGVAMDASVVFTSDSIKFNTKEIRALKIPASSVIDDAHLKKLSFKNLNNISYCLYGTTTVLDTATLVIDPGVVIKCRDYSSMITANGTLTGIGTDLEPIIFTSIADDTYGNPLDSQNDGNVVPGNSSSGRIAIYGKKTSKIENWKINFGGYNSDNWSVYVSNGNIVSKCEIKNSYRGIYFSDNAQLLNNSFLNINYYPLARFVNQGSPVMLGNTISNVGNVGILIAGFGTDSPTLKPMDFAGFTNVAYIVENLITIPASNVITIDPGVVVKFQDYYGGFLVNGAIKAAGKANNKIIFTSLKDDSAGGDTNNNGTATVPASGNWYGINYTGTASDTDNILKNCEIRYSGSTYYISYPDDYNKKSAIRITDCRVAIDSVKVNFTSNCALGIFGNANPVITNSEFYNLGNAPVYMDMFSQPTFTGNKIANLPRVGLLIRGQDISGTVPSRSFAGYDNITYIVEEGMTITGQLTIPAGTTFKGPGIWYIHGKISVQGTADKPVVFTTQEDDAYGIPSDLQQNGASGLNNSGSYFVFYDESNDLSTIDHTIFRYSPTIPIQLTNASPKITNTTFENLPFSGIQLSGSSAPSINNCTFNNISFPFTTSLITYPAETTNNVISGTTGRAIRISDETLTSDVTLAKHDFAGKTNIPYVFMNYTVGTGAKLTIKPGVVCKFMQNGFLHIQNGLIAKGGSTTDSTIVFTADRDDFYGGDTYADGDANQPTNNWWKGIYFYNESLDENCSLENCIIKDASDYYYYPYYAPYDQYRTGAVTVDNASPTLKNCLFESNYYGIISRNTSLPKITNCDFVGTDPTYGFGVFNQTSTNTVTAVNCWWNSNTGPKHSSNPGGLGERVSDYVTFIPWATQLAKPVLGDVSMNGEVKPYDASLVLQYAASNITLSAKQLTVADVSGNGIISSYDASLILQYSVGLISMFDQLGVKSASINDLATISFPDLISEPTKKTFEIPLTVSTAQGIKAMDMKFSINPEHVKFLRINKEKLPAGLSIEAGFNAQKGEIVLSMASAYDLNLISQPMILEFEFVDSAITESQFNLTSAMANDDFLMNMAAPATISSKTTVTGLNAQSQLSAPTVYTDQDGIHTRFELSKSNQNLSFQVVDLLGRTVYQTTVKNLSSGRQYFDLNYTDFENHTNGIYILNLHADDFSYSKKLLLK
ncbi:MAG: right-handed parallel beta-helix repeat-containing protein [Bacteroidia bacterium]